MSALTDTFPKVARTSINTNVIENFGYHKLCARAMNLQWTIVFDPYRLGENDKFTHFVPQEET